jgi:hypothetical protein
MNFPELKQIPRSKLQKKFMQKIEDLKSILQKEGYLEAQPI